MQNNFKAFISMHNEYADQTQTKQGKTLQGNLPYDQLTNDYDQAARPGFLYMDNGIVQNFPNYDTYGNFWKQYIENADVQPDTFTTDRIQWGPFSRVFYVDFNSGTDSPSAQQFGTQLNPFRTLSYALTQVPQFSTIYLTDNGQDVGGSFEITQNNIQIIGRNGGEVTKTQTTILGSVIISGQRIEFIDLAFDSTAYSSATLTINAQHTSLKNCDFATKSGQNSIATTQLASVINVQACRLQRDFTQTEITSLSPFNLTMTGPTYIGGSYSQQYGNSTARLSNVEVLGTIQHGAGALYLDEC